LSEAPPRGDLRTTNPVLTWHTLSKEEVKSKVRESEARRAAQGRRMKKEQEDIEFRTIESMTHKLAFKRNPRHPPSRPPGGFQGRVEHRYKWGVGKIPEVRHPMKATLTSDPSIVVVVEPPVITFTDYRAFLPSNTVLNC
jgi:hypothetical protein